MESNFERDKIAGPGHRAALSAQRRAPGGPLHPAPDTRVGEHPHFSACGEASFPKTMPGDDSWTFPYSERFGVETGEFSRKRSLSGNSGRHDSAGLGQFESAPPTHAGQFDAIQDQRQL